MESGVFFFVFFSFYFCSYCILGHGLGLVYGYGHIRLEYLAVGAVVGLEGSQLAFGTATKVLNSFLFFPGYIYRLVHEL